MPKLLAKINLKAIGDNARAFKTLTNTRLCAVVKADGYGHGAERVVYSLAHIADFFAVSSVEEALSIQAAACGTPILVLTPPVKREEAETLVLEEFRCCIADTNTLNLILSAAKKYKKRAFVHLKVNTGMNRYGMGLSELNSVCKTLATKDCVCVEGLFSHLYTHDQKTSEKQRLLFEEMRAVCKAQFPSVLCHLSSTYGALLGKDYAYDMVRVGLGLYGYLPQAKLKNPPPLQKALSLWASVVQSREYSGGGLGYGTPKKSAVKKALRKGLCVIQSGYGDGLNRAGGIERFDEQISRALCMDACILAGKKKAGEKISVLTDAAAVAKRCKTIPYEILCSLTKRAEREYGYE